MVGYKVVSASLESLWCNQPAFVQPRRDGDPPRPLSFRTGETVEDDDVGVFCYDSPGHPMLTNGAWRTKYHDARVVVLEYDEADVLQSRSGERGETRLRRCRVVGEIPLP